MLLVLLVDDGAGGLEAAPNFLAKLLGNGANLAILYVQLLQLVECAHHIILSAQALSLFAKLGLQFQVFLEVVLACLAVEVEQVVELLHIELVVAPHLVGLLSGNGLDVFPFLLQGLELIV